jgi:hypothetical protein
MLRSWLTRGIVLAALVAACSSVSQSEYDDLEERLDTARDQLAAVEVERAALLENETAVAAYIAATDPIDLAALEDVYVPDAVVFDAARGVTFRSRATAIADIASGVAAFGVQAQITRGATIAADGAVIEWELRGVDDIGSDWSFRGVSVLGLEDGLVAFETLYYDPEDAPWGG